MGARAAWMPTTLGSERGVGGDMGPVYTCPMHAEIRQSAPGACPRCGMALELVAPTLDEGENPELVTFVGASMGLSR